MPGKTADVTLVFQLPTDARIDQLRLQFGNEMVPISLTAPVR